MLFGVLKGIEIGVFGGSGICILVEGLGSLVYKHLVVPTTFRSWEWDDGRRDIAGVVRGGWTMYVSSATIVCFSSAVDTADDGRLDVDRAVQSSWTMDVSSATIVYNWADIDNI
jgi:hypothetical protein